MRTALAPCAAFLLLGLVAGCSCGDTRARPGDAAGPAIDSCDPCDAAPDAPIGDAGPDARDSAPPLDAYPSEASMDTGAAVDGGADIDTAPADAGTDTGPALDACASPGCDDAGPEPDTGPVDSGPDAGCRSGLLGCLGPDGRLVCIDPLRDDCNCGACGVQGTCIGGIAIADCPESYTRCPVCDVPYDAEWRRICTQVGADPQHCSECFHACDATEWCFRGTCEPRP